MSSFQKVVNLYQAGGIPGAYAAINPIVSTALGYIAEKDVPIGGFCWLGSEDNTCLPSGTGSPLGFVVREVTNPIVTLRGEAQDYVPAGFNVSVQRKGDFYAISATDATLGQKVFAVIADGSIATDDAGATVAGAIETDYVVIKAGDAGDLIIISNW